jgi:hypothetical protein
VQVLVVQGPQNRPSRPIGHGQEPASLPPSTSSRTR